MNVEEALASSIEAKLRSKPPLSSQACIFRVPHVLFRQSEGAFAPHIVSIGPCYHGHENLKSMEDFKLWYLHGLLSRRPIPQTSLKIFTKDIQQLEERAREYYTEHLVDFDTDEFMEMMLVDGCFILEHFCRKRNGIDGRQRDDPISSVPWMDSNLRVDLMLLENQILWVVLECLFNLTMPPGERSSSLAELALGFFDTMMPTTVLAKSSSRLETKHILDLLWNNIISASANVELTLENDQYWEVIPKVTDLVEAKVKFRKGNHEEILNIRFKDGVMEIPPLLIQGSTKLLFRNLILMSSVVISCLTESLLMLISVIEGCHQLDCSINSLVSLNMVVAFILNNGAASDCFHRTLRGLQQELILVMKLGFICTSEVPFQHAFHKHINGWSKNSSIAYLQNVDLHVYHNNQSIWLRMM
ncbi:UPF0481 protein At3g47200-like [Macadamia integrifolia]|uniref:UPF0481 protein At3g47200-like n=1 Tax=Macadamia integrifolia TaxID=60698 RepID=UPI001C528681|nr:UPF0481 protein At3g47200-like [Macadamia integrifolia]